MKERTGQIFEKKNGLWVARVCYPNVNGKRTAIQRMAESKSEASKILKTLLEKLDKGGRETIDAKKLLSASLRNIMKITMPNPLSSLISAKSKENDETLREAAQIFESIQEQSYIGLENNFEFLIESELVN